MSITTKILLRSKVKQRFAISLTQYPYDTFNDDDLTLRGNTNEVSEELAQELQERLAVAGVEVIETRLNHLAYATEIASAMLQRQQAKAILSARQIIVEGAVSMTQMALEQIEDGQDINFTDDRKVQLINNLLVSIITDKGNSTCDQYRRCERKAV